MTWIKRNLFFVIGLAVGLGLTGFCAFLFYKDLGDTQQASNDFLDKASQYHNLQHPAPGVPNASEENIKLAQTDQQTALKFLADTANAFGNYPTPPKVDERGFKTFMEDTVSELKNEAKAAEVQLPDEFAFGFSDQMSKLNFPAADIPPWMQQLIEIKALSQILFQAKINKLENLRRVHVSDDDTGSFPDFIEARTITNQSQIVTPYMFTFEGFSREVAAVLLGLAQSSNYYVVMDIDVKVDFTAVLQQQQQQQQQMQQMGIPATPGFQNNPGFSGRPTGGPVGPPPGVNVREWMMTHRGMPQQPVPATPAPVVPSGPVTVLSERLLKVTIALEAVKSKGGGH